MKTIPLLLMGCGGVGRQLLGDIASCRLLHAKQGIQLRVVGVSDSKSLVAPSNVLTGELNDDFLSEVCRLKSQRRTVSLSDLMDFGENRLHLGTESTSKMMEIAALLGKSTGLAVVDCSASSETVEILTQVVDLGCCIVLANKKPLTSSLESFDKLMSFPRRIRHESTVGAGLPVIASLNRVLSSGDPVNHIIGSLSGTLGYLMSALEDGEPLSEAVKAAKRLGYTEPDPRDDLSGMDVARKALILARLLGRRMTMDNIKIESLYPPEMAPDVMSVDEFMSKGIILLDKKFQERAASASSCAMALRYVCVIDQNKCTVGLREVPKNSPLGRLRGSDNVVEIHSRCYIAEPLVIQGTGAGNDTTAAGVLADILDIQDLFP